MRHVFCRFAAPLFAGVLVFIGLTMAGAVNTAAAAVDRPSAKAASSDGWPEDEPEAAESTESTPAANGTTHTVGAGQGCDFANLQSAIDAAADGDTIRLAESGDYVGETYSILNFDGHLAIQGGYENCLDSTLGSRTVLNANKTGRVMNVTQNASFSGTRMLVTLEDLDIYNGRTSGSFGGGGLLVQGQPGLLDVRLKNVRVRNNHATKSGGGINVWLNGNRQGSGTILTIDNDSEITNNKAGGSGGGISCTSRSYGQGVGTLMRLGGAPVAFNEAGINGGGLSFIGCRQIYIYTGLGSNPFAGILGNTSNGNGGGIAVEQGAQVSVRGSSWSSFGDPEVAARIAGNNAGSGGGIYVGYDSPEGERSSLTLEDVIVENNSAEIMGGGGFVQGQLRMRRMQNEPCQPLSGFTYPRCSRIDGNASARSGTAQALEVHVPGEIEIIRTDITGHSRSGGGYAGHVIRLADAAATFEGVLFHDNIGRLQMLLLTGESKLTMGWSTIAANAAYAAMEVLEGADVDIDIHGSIIHEDGGSIIAEREGAVTRASLDCVIGHQGQGDLVADAVSYYSEIDPGFVDPQNGDFHLATNSPAIDYCDDRNAPQYRGLDGNVRGTAHEGPALIVPSDPVPGGLYDLGAYEMIYLSDGIFEDRFEG